MNRRGFLGTLGKVVAGFTILPPATTYNRIWRATPEIIRPKIELITPFWYQTARYSRCTDAAYDEWMARLNPYRLESEKEVQRELMSILFPLHYGPAQLSS